MDAFFLIDKPKGITSFGVLKQMRKTLWIRKLWHTGTLDPLATGALLVATGKYTKLIPYFEKDTKSYECEIRLDGVSDSYDIDTPVRYISEQDQAKAKQELTIEKIEKILRQNFLGDIVQVPPVYSALKIQGKKAVDLVREGKTPEMKSRKVTISDIEILSFSYPAVCLRLTVSAGTYIRSIAKDLWDMLWTGGYISSLRRIAIGNIGLEKSVTLESVSPQGVFPEKLLFSSDMFFKIQDESVLLKLSYGQKIPWKFDFPSGKEIFLFGENKIQYIVKYDQGVLVPVRKIL